MSEKRIDELTAATTVAGGDAFPVVPTGTTVAKQVTATNMLSFFDAAGAASSEVSTHAAAPDPHGDRAYAAGLVDDLSGVTNAATARTNLGLVAIASSGSASDLGSGTVPTARLGSGTASSSTFLRGDSTWATVSGGAVDPGWTEKSGTTYRMIPGWVQNTRATNGWGASTYYVPIIVASAITLSDARMDVTATGTATTARVAWYNPSTGTSHQPGSLVADMGTATVSATGTKTISSTVTLAAGRYLVAWTANGTFTTNISIGASGGASSWVDLANNNMTAIMSVSSDQTAGFASTGTAWTSWSGENRGWYMPIYFTRTA